MALPAGHRHMGTCERKAGLLMARQGKLSRLKAPHRVALIAAIPVRRARELPLVNILMTTAALGLR